MNEEQDPSEPERGTTEPEQRSVWLVLLGVVVGLVVAVVLPLLVLQNMLGSSQASDGVALWFAAFGPAILGLVVLLVPAWRRAGAGFVMGLAVGAVIFGGICATVATMGGA